MACPGRRAIERQGNETSTIQNWTSISTQVTRMKQSLHLAVAAATMGMITFASAGHFEIGSEVESFNSAYEDKSLYLPYVTIGGNPIKGSDFHAELKTSYSQHDSSAKRDSSNRYRHDILVGNTWSSGDFTFAPEYLLRQDFMSDGSRIYEHRIFPNMSYRINDTFSLGLDGFVALVQAKRQEARGSDHNSDSSVFNYNDYKHEFDFCLDTRISDTQLFTVSVFTEYGKINDMNENDEHRQETAEEWQLRLIYSHNFGNFTLEPFVRIGLSRDVETISGKTLDEKRHRYGVAGSYQLTPEVTLVGEVYGQTQGLEGVNTDGEIYSKDDKNMMFYKIGVNYTF